VDCIALEGEGELKTMKRLGKGKEWEITDQNGATWHYKAVSRMEPVRFGRPTWSEYEEPYLCWNRHRYYLSEFFVRPEAGSSGLSLFDGISPLSYGSGVGVRLGADGEGQLIYFYVS